MKEKAIYQIVYCDSKFWDEERPLKEQVEQTFRWYLLKCPAIGIEDLDSARNLAKEELKDKFGARAQVIVIGEVKGQFEEVTFDDLLGITTLRGSHATEYSSELIFTKRGKKPVFYSREDDLGYGHFPPR